MTNDRSPNLVFIGLAWIIMFLGHTAAHALRVPAHVFPDSDSTVLEYIDIPDSEVASLPEVLDASLEGTWYWTTHEGEFTGYVSKRDMKDKKSLKKGTLIRVNPTYSSWILTKYEPDDDIRVRSRLSVGRVSVKKEIPVYFRLEDSVQNNQNFVAVEPEPEIQTVPDAAYEAPVVQHIQEPEFSENVEEPEVVQIESAPEVVDDIPEDSPILQAASDDNPSTIAVIPEETDSVEDTAPVVDPLLEEKPRISPQELVDMAPPPSKMYQEFEGFMKVVPKDDPHAKEFQYQLESRSGRRIVYIDTSGLVGKSYDTHLDEWINIRGSLEEKQPDFALYIEARSIWVAP